MWPSLGASLLQSAGGRVCGYSWRCFLPPGAPPTRPPLPSPAHPSSGLLARVARRAARHRPCPTARVPGAVPHADPVLPRLHRGHRSAIPPPSIQLSLLAPFPPLPSLSPSRAPGMSRTPVYGRPTMRKQGSHENITHRVAQLAPDARSWVSALVTLVVLTGLSSGGPQKQVHCC